MFAIQVHGGLLCVKITEMDMRCNLGTNGWDCFFKKIRLLSVSLIL